MIKRTIFILLSCLMMVSNASAAIQSRTIDYKSADGAILEGYVVYDDARKSPRPGIIIVSNWMGLGQYARDKADLLAREGYVAFAADVYGRGVRPANKEEAGKLAGMYKNNRILLRTRMRAAYDALEVMPQVDPGKIVVMGYCFGGTAALELARSGTPVAGTASFHGGLSSPTPQDAKNIKGPVLVMHGGDDPFVPPPEVAAFKQEMGAAHVNMKFISYPGAVHGFTDPDAGDDNSKGMAYNASADKKSWAEFEKFLKQVFHN